MNRIGERIKRKREQLKLQLNDLARLVGVSSSALSQIENAKASPSVATLKSIAENLHTTVGELIGENESWGRDPVTRRDEMRLIDQNESGTKLYLLSGHEINNNMDAYLLRFRKGSDIKDLFTDYNGQVFCRISRGRISFLIDGKQYELEADDNVYFTMKSLESIHSVGKEKGELLWVITPPFFSNEKNRK
ncbi:MAG: helix-turn-helix transcriptional regulator [Bacteroidales bacterium]|nr:helix-turn-helix transcriptional regulator [Bacteroidales bacterium]